MVDNKINIMFTELVYNYLRLSLVVDWPSLEIRQVKITKWESDKLVV